MESLTNHSPFSQAAPLNMTSSSLLPAQLHRHSYPAAGSLPPPFSTESKHVLGKRHSSWTNVSCLLRPLGGFARVPCFILACCLANPGNIQRTEPSAKKRNCFPIVKQNHDKVFLSELLLSVCFGLQSLSLQLNFLSNQNLVIIYKCTPQSIYKFHKSSYRLHMW